MRAGGEKGKPRELEWMDKKNHDQAKTSQEKIQSMEICGGAKFF